jgi:hypothetical protein
LPGYAVKSSFVPAKNLSTTLTRAVMKNNVPTSAEEPDEKGHAVRYFLPL